VVVVVESSPRVVAVVVSFNTTKVIVVEPFSP
jgi:hypothetical protein